jgi:hypothetical protein
MVLYLVVVSKVQLEVDVVLLCRLHRRDRGETKRILNRHHVPVPWIMIVAIIAASQLLCYADSAHGCGRSIVRNSVLGYGHPVNSRFVTQNLRSVWTKQRCITVPQGIVPTRFGLFVFVRTRKFACFAFL